MDTASREPEWLTVSEVAQHFRVSPKTISRWAVSGEIRSKRIGSSGRLVRIHRSAIDTEHDTPSAVA